MGYPSRTEEGTDKPSGVDPNASPPSTLRTCVVVPAFNEGRSVAEVVQAVHRVLPRATVVVIDDGSSDDTAEQAAAAGAVVIPLPVNLGIGGAVQTGYLYALRNGCDVAVQVDGDGQHDSDEIQRLLVPLLDGTADMVVGSRWLGRGDYLAPSSRRLGMRMLAGLVTLRTGQRFTDTTSGFRAVGRKGLELFAVEYPTDYPEVETIVLATKRGLRLAEVPVAMMAREHGRSSIAGLRSAYYMARVGLAIILGQPSTPPAP